MTELTITAAGVRYIDTDQRTYTPSKGDVVTVASDSVVRTLLRGQRAVRGRVNLEAVQAEPAVAAPDAVAAPVAVDQNSGGGGTGEAENASETPSWADVEGLSRPSLALLTKNAPTGNPLTASKDDLIEWLEGSTRRADLAFKALEKWRGTDEASGGGDA